MTCFGDIIAQQLQRNHLQRRHKQRTGTWDRDDVIALSLKTGDEAVVAIEYALEGGDTYQGNAVITGYTEDSSASADSDTTVSLNLQVNGDFTKKNA